MVLKEFQYDCVNPKSLEELECIIDNAKEITYQTFRKNIEEGFIKDFNSTVGIPLSQERYVAFYKSKTIEGKVVYFFEHSAIEYVFY